LTSDTI